MIRNEQLKYCKTCENVGYNSENEIICKKAEKIAGFENICWNFLVEDKNIKIETDLNLSQIQTNKKEIISSNDLSLLLGIILIATFLFRFIVYANFSYQKYFTSIKFLTLIFISFTIALLLREKEIRKYRFFGDVKFKLIFSFLITSINVFYNLLVYQNFNNIFTPFLSIFIFSFILSFFSYILVKPINAIYLKFSKSE